ncbi:irregular chiasm C-roughest protein-like [Topomyia yanbarensis]|uniref:irregular chiasm C-roughest protein-like n=1 Tax=Topomyia yanbarensis TaxID=2498891 RepID=UPI00273BB71F|nr:irregular chiasm C-roughest protein-like [Topomyia yanbarensis]XP_058812545.1 irregular chiasm C-roughest protein-like [Topomyia yanbarensis]XP_058812553.1 irregular chiasm C-roughest protein-like [Topomyia yanbarensis]XP_058812562.1 irregular chiasm C-roughest protein-like [Topomyia yanbarensis]XP_058812571.1 irregular chiasm C-roughest protein-like [Topomyia yanbarensis]XP_058812580.1 irregular chiasm C-roughest protein-like [Topomyia yanbarensis]XP_058812590.1 irregular chiasm C-roughes
MDQLDRLDLINSENHHPEEKSCRSQSWSKRRRRKWVLSNCCAVPFRYFYLFLLIRISAVAVKNPSSVGSSSSSSAIGERIYEQHQRFAMEPQDQTAVVGSRVTLPCRVVNKSGQLQWTKDDFGLGTNRILAGFERYSMIGSDEEGDFSLDIFPVMLDDDAKYQCQVGPGKKGTPGIRSRFAALTVLVPPEPPTIVQGDFMVTTENREIELECVSVGGRPAAEMTWIDGLGNVLTSGIEYMKEPLSDARRFTAKSILKLTPKKEHHNTTFTCQAQNTADRTYRSVRLKLEVKYAPKVSITIISSNDGRILEGSEVRLHCHADANPPDVTYRWYVGNEMLIGDYSTELVILNTSKKYHGTVVECEVRNVVGKSEKSETLDISYAPSFRSLPKSVEADLETMVSLFCDVDSNPSPDIVWMHDGSGRVASTLANFTLTVMHSTAGRYVCKASVPGFPEVEAEATVYLRGPPSISSPRQQFGSITDTGRLECEAFSIPKAKHIIWAHNGHDINTSSEHDEYTVIESHQPEGVKSTLIIHNSQRQHFGGYNCTVINDYGLDFVEIEFISKENILLPVIIFGSLGGLTLLIIIVLLATCLWSRKSRKELPPADVIPKHHVSEKDCKELDRRTSNVSDLKIDRDNEFMETNLGSDGMTTQVNVVLGSSTTIANPNHARQLDEAVGSIGRCTDFRAAEYFTDSFNQLSGKSTGNNSSTYAPFMDYSREYNAPATHLMQFRTSTSSNNIKNDLSPQNHNPITSSGPTTLGRHRMPVLRQDNGLSSIQGSVVSLSNSLIKPPLLHGHLTIDYRYGSSYVNSNHRTANSNSSITIPPATANPAVTPAPPPYNVATRSAQGLGAATTTGNLTTGSGSSPGTAGADSTSPSSIQSSSLSLSLDSQQSQVLSSLPTGGGETNGSSAAPLPGSPSTGTGQFILPNSSLIKQQGSHATHV